MSANKFAAAAAAAAKVTNMTEAQSGGGFEAAAEGPTRLRLVGYVELGQHMGSYQGKPKKENIVEVTLELSGPKHPPREHDGNKYPHLITLKLSKSLADKAKFFKLFQILNWEGKATHMAELLGAAYTGTVIHRKYKGKDGKERIAVELWDKVSASWKIEAPRKLDYETGEYLPLKVDEAITEQQCFLWDHADMAQWASIFVDGEYPEEKNEDGTVKRAARSKNVRQNKIKQALNFKDSPIYALLLNNGQPLDIPEPEVDDADEDHDGEAEPTGSNEKQGMPDPLAG